MKKIIIGGIVVVLLFSWTYVALSQRGNNTATVEKQAAANQGSQTDELAKRLMIQQQESRENLRRLAEGEIKSFEITQIKPDEKQVFLKTFYNDQSFLDGRLDIEDIGGLLYCTTLTRLSNIPHLPGQQVASVGAEEIALGRKIVKDQGNNQDVPKKLLNGDITRIDIKNLVNKNSDATTVEAVAALKDGSTKQVKINMVFLNGYWYIKSFI